MKVATKFALAFLACGILSVLVYSAVATSREAQQMEETVAEDLASLGHTLSHAVLAVWDRDGVETLPVEPVGETRRGQLGPREPIPGVERGGGVEVPDQPVGDAAEEVQPLLVALVRTAAAPVVGVVIRAVEFVRLGRGTCGLGRGGLLGHSGGV